MSEKEWLMLNFTLPKEPSRVRVSVWRKLKKYGSICIGQSMWLLPISEKNKRVFNEISIEITQNNGSAYILNANFIAEADTEEIINKFNAVRNEEYQEFLGKCDDFFREIENETKKRNFTYAELEENEEEYNKLTEWLKKIAIRDFYNASLKIEAEKRLETCKQFLDDFSNKVYETNQE